MNQNLKVGDQVSVENLGEAVVDSINGTEVEVHPLGSSPEIRIRCLIEGSRIVRDDWKKS